MVILNPTIPDEEMPAALERVGTAVTAHGGEAGEPQIEPPWGRRRLAYPIGDQREGYYAVSRIKLDPTQMTELDRALKLNNQVLRFLVSRPDE
jgi:small subunit ribosomal protein S6